MARYWWRWQSQTLGSRFRAGQLCACIAFRFPVNKGTVVVTCDLYSGGSEFAIDDRLDSGIQLSTNC